MGDTGDTESVETTGVGDSSGYASLPRVIPIVSKEVHLLIHVVMGRWMIMGG